MRFILFQNFNNDITDLYEDFWIGQVVQFKEFVFFNKVGGIGKSNWSYNERFTTCAQGKVIKVVSEIKTAGALHIEPISDVLKEYLKRNALTQIVCVSQLDALKIENVIKENKWLKNTEALLGMTA